MGLPWVLSRISISLKRTSESRAQRRFHQACVHPQLRIPIVFSQTKKDLLVVLQHFRTQKDLLVVLQHFRNIETVLHEAKKDDVFVLKTIIKINLKFCQRGHRHV